MILELKVDDTREHAIVQIKNRNYLHKSKAGFLQFLRYPCNADFHVYYKELFKNNLYRKKLMQIEDMIQKYNFHDSNVIKLSHDCNRVKLKIDLCMWKQAEYKEGDDEQKEVLLEFDSVADYIWDSDKNEVDIDYDTILEISYNNGTLKIVLADDGGSILIFKCNTVEFIYTHDTLLPEQTQHQIWNVIYTHDR